MYGMGKRRILTEVACQQEPFYSSELNTGMDDLNRILELAGVTEDKPPTIVSASTAKNGGIDRKKANRMVDPKGWFKGSSSYYLNHTKGITEGFDISDVSKALNAEFWRPTFETKKLQVWKHMDDPELGEYVIHFSPTGIEKIEYVLPLSSIFNRTFITLGPFLKHLSETTDENISDEDLAKGTAKLRDIAKQLRNEGAPAKSLRDYLIEMEFNPKANSEINEGFRIFREMAAKPYKDLRFKTNGLPYEGGVSNRRSYDGGFQVKILLAKHGNQIGDFMVRFEGDTIHIHIGIFPMYQRKGYGRITYDFVDEFAHAIGKRFVPSGTNTSASARIWRARGHQV